MCLIAWNWRPESAERLLLVGNRDEFYDRPALPLHWWDDAPILAGRDLTGGGTWLGVSRDGRLAALTNYRLPEGPRANAKTRGALVSGFLERSTGAIDYLESVRRDAADYNPFNLLVFDGRAFFGLESRHDRILEIAPGFSGVSNADFLTPWPKLNRLIDGMNALDRQGLLSEDAQLLKLLRNPRPAPDYELPNTGIPIERERQLSSAFIATPNYGTRASTIVRIGSPRSSVFEHTFDALGATGAATMMF